MPVVHSVGDEDPEDVSSTRSEAQAEKETTAEDSASSTTVAEVLKDGGKTKQSSSSGPAVEVERKSPPSDEPEDGSSSDENSGGKKSKSSDDSSKMTNGHAGQEKREVEEFGIIDNAYYRLFHLRHFRYDDISVQMDGRNLLINAKHKYYADEHGLASRTFIRKIELPDFVLAEKVGTYFSGDGVLVVKAPCAEI